MAAEGKKMPSIEISLRLGLPLQSLLGEEGAVEVQREVVRYAEGIAADLGLPTPQVDVCNPSASPAGFDVVINSVPCRVPFARDRGIAPASSSKALASRIAQIIHLNRELLIDEQVAEAIRTSRSSKQAGRYLSGLSRKAFRDYLRLLVRGCFCLHKGDFLNDPMRSPLPRWTAQACYEEAVRSLSGLRCLLWISPGAARTSEVDNEPIEQLLDRLQKNLFYELGVRFPRMAIREDESLGEGEFRIQINDLRLPWATGMEEGEFLVNATPDHLKLLNMEGRAVVNPDTGVDASIVMGGAEAAKKARDAELTAWGRGGYIFLACSGELLRHAAAYITVESIEHDLDLLRSWYNDVIAWARGRFGLPMITQVLRSLVEEGISVRHLLGVLEAMLAIKSTVEVDFGKYIVFYPYATALCPAGFGNSIEDVESIGYAECVRSQFKESITYKYTGGQGTLIAYLLDPEIESRVARSATNPLTDQEMIDIRKAVQEEIAALHGTDRTPVILTTFEIRKLFRRLIEVEFPDLAALSYHELAPDLNIQPIARIALR